MVSTTQLSPSTAMLPLQYILVSVRLRLLLNSKNTYLIPDFFLPLSDGNKLNHKRAVAIRLTSHIWDFVLCHWRCQYYIFQFVLWPNRYTMLLCSHKLCRRLIHPLHYMNKIVDVLAFLQCLMRKKDDSILNGKWIIPRVTAFLCFRHLKTNSRKNGNSHSRPLS